MTRSIRPSLYDIRQAIEGMENAIAGKSLPDFKNDWLLRHAIQRGVEIISEASRRIPQNVRETEPAILWRDIAGIGNILRHEYESVSDEIIWNIVQNHLAPLKLAIQRIEASLPTDEDRT
jgi:uncharacterized protein with HEPN domain